MDNNYFDSSNGFGEYKDIAIELLKETIQILDEFNINHCLISGTLLGYVRHNDFIPWDDDIDLIVDETIIAKLNAINDKYKQTITLINKDNFLIKTCFKHKGVSIKSDAFKPYMLNSNDIYQWPFIDLFVYKTHNNRIDFFDKKWYANEFFPLNKVQFHNISVNIPSNPNYFLSLNYGSKYMTTFKSSAYDHKNERSIIDRKMYKIKNKKRK